MNNINISFLCIYLCFSVSLSAQNIEPSPTCKVDERTELMSVVFRLVGAKEYVNNQVGGYMTDVDNYFNPYKEDTVVKFAKVLREKFGVSYDAVMSMAVNLKIENNNVSLIDNVNLNDIDDRWQYDSIPKFTKLLNEYYQKSNFHFFYSQHEKLYSKSVANFNKNILEKINLNWFDKFFGSKSHENFNIIISLLNGTGNFGAHTKIKGRKEELYAILGTCRTDSLGCPVYDGALTSTVIHEFNHSYCDRLISDNMSNFLPQAKILYELVKPKMLAMAYGEPQTYLCEILVRACVVKYLKENINIKDKTINFKLEQERNKGFLWINNLYEGLSKYENNRKIYASLESYMVEIVKIQNKLNPKQMYRIFVNNQPIIIGTNMENGDQAIDPNLDKIIIRFNKPMDIGCNGSSFGKCKDCEFPNIISAQWNKKNKKEWILNVTLKPNTIYSISFPVQFFYSEKEYYNPKETYYLDFKTR